MPGRGPNQYGYDFKIYCVPQLQRVLNLEHRPQAFEDAKENIRVLVKRYMDIGKIPSQQQEALDLVKKKLHKKYPVLYGGEDSERKLFFAEKVIRLIHGNMRKNYAKRASSRITANANRSSPPHPDTGATSARSGEASALTPASSSLAAAKASANSSNQRHPTISSPPRRDVHLDAPGSTNSNENTEPANTSRNLPPTPLSVVRPRARKTPAIPFVLIPSAKSNGASASSSMATPQNSQAQEDRKPGISSNAARKVHSTPGSSSTSAPSGSRLAPNSFLSSEPAPSPAQIQRPASTASALDTHATASSSSSSSSSSSARAHAESESESDIAAVRQFLLACKPPMGHFLSRFVDFGWKNKDFLYAMSTWSDEYRDQMLRRVAFGEARTTASANTRDGNVNNAGATEAEIAVLDYHLMRYGFQIEKENIEA